MWNGRVSGAATPTPSIPKSSSPTQPFTSRWARCSPDSWPGKPRSRANRRTPGSHRPLAADSYDGLDRLTTLAGWLLHAPISFVSLVSDDTEVITSAVGVPDQLLGRELPLDQSICQHVVASGDPLVIFDAEDDPLVRDNVAVATYGLRAYAGLALRLGRHGDRKPLRR